MCDGTARGRGTRRRRGDARGIDGNAARWGRWADVGTSWDGGGAEGDGACAVVRPWHAGYTLWRAIPCGEGSMGGSGTVVLRALQHLKTMYVDAETVRVQRHAEGARDAVAGDAASAGRSAKSMKN